MKFSNRKSQEGAAMMVVMIVLLMATATATFAIHSTTFEVRAAGSTVQSMQTEYVAESGLNATLGWVDQFRAEGVVRAMEQTKTLNEAQGRPAVDLAPFEPQLSPNKRAYRLYSEDLQALAAAPIDDAYVGRRVAQPRVLIDLYDDFKCPQLRAGEHAEGRSKMSYLCITYTSRGRTSYANDFRNPATAYQDRDYHEGASDARAYGVTGPSTGL